MNCENLHYVRYSANLKNFPTMLPGDPTEEPDKNPLGQGLFHETLAPQCRGIHQYSLDYVTGMEEQ